MRKDLNGRPCMREDPSCKKVEAKNHASEKAAQKINNMKDPAIYKIRPNGRSSYLKDLSVLTIISLRLVEMDYNTAQNIHSNGRDCVEDQTKLLQKIRSCG